MPAHTEPDGSVKIRIESLHYAYQRHGRQDVVALNDVNLTIAKGEFLSVVGPSGCGKSTLLRILAGLQKPTSGTVSIRVDDGSRPLMAPVFQEYSIYPWRTVEGNVRLGLDAAGVPRREADERVRE